MCSHLSRLYWNHTFTWLQDIASSNLLPFSNTKESRSLKSFAKTNIECFVQIETIVLWNSIYSISNVSTGSTLFPIRIPVPRLSHTFTVRWFNQFIIIFEWIMHSYSATVLFCEPWFSLNFMSKSHGILHKHFFVSSSLHLFSICLEKYKVPATVCCLRRSCCCHSRWAWPRGWCQWIDPPRFCVGYTYSITLSFSASPGECVCMRYAVRKD